MAIWEEVTAVKGMAALHLTASSASDIRPRGCCWPRSGKRSASAGQR
jgi:hypothetical protein